jgi:hypothetical protein
MASDPMNRDDDLAIRLAAERRRHDERERNELDARLAELPRAIATADDELLAGLRRLGRYVLAALLGGRL